MNKRIVDPRQMFPSEYSNHTDLIDADGKRHTVKLIVDFGRLEETKMDGGVRSESWVLHFRPKPRPNGGKPWQLKPLVLNVTNKRAIISQHGLPDAWSGKEIELFIGQAKSPPKWKPVYGPTMPSLRIRGKDGGNEDLKQQLKEEDEDPPPLEEEGTT